MSLRMPRDVQRSRLYEWEDGLIAKVLRARSENSKLPMMTMDECKALVKEVYDAYGFKVPHVRPRRGWKAEGSHREIKLSKSTMTKYIVLHECAHGLAVILKGTAEPWHGPTFVGIFVELLNHWCGLDWEILHQSLMYYTIKFNDGPEVKVPERKAV
jgi:hypothetical protein